MPAQGTRRRGRAAFALALTMVVAVPSMAAAAEAPPPAAWPSSAAASPRIEGSAHAVRFAGGDRYSTSLA
ncbi:MAG: prephenate dehydratase, partial [Acidimicrobiia bacterium]|nr:prephenate dehydratase [Acidimicrobiia bacterium]